jgi:hypothetical protein
MKTSLTYCNLLLLGEVSATATPTLLTRDDSLFYGLRAFEGRSYLTHFVWWSVSTPEGAKWVKPIWCVVFISFLPDSVASIFFLTDTVGSLSFPPSFGATCDVVGQTTWYKHPRLTVLPSHTGTPTYPSYHFRLPSKPPPSVLHLRWDNNRARTPPLNTKFSTSSPATLLPAAPSHIRRGVRQRSSYLGRPSLHVGVRVLGIFGGISADRIHRVRGSSDQIPRTFYYRHIVGINLALG